MIIFDLICSDRHIFEGWFSSSDDYQSQKRMNMLLCPICGCTNVTKSVMAPNIGLKSNQKSLSQGPRAKASDLDQSLSQAKMDQDDKINAHQPPKKTETDIIDTVRKLDDGALKAITSALVKAQNEALKKSTWVGGKFAQEARAIHYGEADKRQIHGHTSYKEAAELQDEGIDIAALPMPFIPPDVKN